MNTRRLMSLIAPGVALALLPLGATSGVVSAQTASGCLGSANVKVISRAAEAGEWTPNYYSTTTPLCRDFNVKVTDYPVGCTIKVDAQYKKNGTWVDGAHDDFWFLPDKWQTPLTSLADGTPVRARFYFQCNDKNVRIHMAA